MTNHYTLMDKTEEMLMEEEEVLETGHVAPALREAHLPKLKDIASSFTSGAKRLDQTPHPVQRHHTILKETARPVPLFDLRYGDLYKQKTISKHTTDLDAFSMGDLATSGCPTMTRQGLLPGLTFKGTQHNNDHQYNVSVEIKAVDFLRGRVGGYLTIENLTATLPTLTTYFDGEMVDPHGDSDFLSGQWGSNATFDLMHWNRFPYFAAHREQFLKKAEKGKAHPYDPRTSDYIFMRWKERFLVPNHRMETLQGASYAGFYYMCYQLSTGLAVGFYFHESSDLFQEITVNAQPQHEQSSFTFA